MKLGSPTELLWILKKFSFCLYWMNIRLCYQWTNLNWYSQILVHILPIYYRLQSIGQINHFSLKNRNQLKEEIFGFQLRYIGTRGLRLIWHICLISVIATVMASIYLCGHCLNKTLLVSKFHYPKQFTWQSFHLAKVQLLITVLLSQFNVSTTRFLQMHSHFQDGLKQTMAQTFLTLQLTQLSLVMQMHLEN